MIITGKKRKKVIAVFFLALLMAQDFYPAAAYALTSGPSQPEMQKFSPAGADNMVDLFSGDFKYDIPLMDVGGYPLNLTYHSGTQMEDEASWVGEGWTLNPGAVNRTMRGIPDDFTGDNNGQGDPQDIIRTTQVRKQFEKIGGSFTLKPTIVGFNVGSASLTVGVYKDNYFGIGAELGASVDFDLARAGCMSLTAGLGLSSDTRTGVTLNPSMSLSACYDDTKENNNAAITGGFAYNTRSGLEKASLSASFSYGTTLTDDYGDAADNVSGKFGVGSFTKIFGHSYIPSFGYNTATTEDAFSFDLGPDLFGGYLGIGGKGYVHVEKNVEPHTNVPAYGYMHYLAGLNNSAAQLDFNREKDGPFMPNQPAIPVPVATNDYFEATSQAGAQQFRPWFNGNYIVYDRPFTKTSTTVGAGVTIGAINLFQGGAQVNVESSSGHTHIWNSGQYICSALPPNANATQMCPLGVSNTDPRFEQYYFKQAGEQVATGEDFYSAIWNSTDQKVGVSASSAGGAQTFGYFSDGNGNTWPVAHPALLQRAVRTSAFSYLTAAQATLYGLDKTINGSPRVDVAASPTTDPLTVVHKAHHISEITVTDKDGKRMVYGIPVYNTDRVEVTMSLPKPASGTTYETDRRTGQIAYTAGVDNSENNQNGRDWVYNRKEMSPYATSYLLTGILSPDYQDLTGDGISDDDLGTAVKFSYVKTNGANGYHWRAPYTNANYNEGFYSDAKDDKGTYVYGTKELWYLHTIRGKTLQAVFYTSPRQDGLGVAGENGGQNTSDVVQKLDSIQLYSIADLNRNPNTAIPIKVVHFVYNYSLYPGVPNNSAGQGKLTLQQVYFTFGFNSRGQTNPYVFKYDMRPIANPGAWGTSGYTDEQPETYDQRQTDRWGTYRQNWFTTSSHVFYNSEFPYSIQASVNGPYDERLLADRFASKWQLDTVNTPSGGEIDVQYESDDYSYVQDQKAMIMCQVAGVGSNGSSSGLINSTMLYVKVPVNVTSTADFVKYYLTGSDGVMQDNIFYKVRSNIDNRGDNEYVQGYAAVDPNPADYQMLTTNGDTTYGIPLQKVSGYNPIAVQAWQMLQDDLPQYAYPNYDNSNVDGLMGNLSAAVRSIVQAFVNLRELAESFDEIASGSKYADQVDLTHSLVRLNYPVGLPNGESTAAHWSFGKLGGGSRVHSVQLSDNWDMMVRGGKQMAYGMQYDYTTTDDQGRTISSGVAAYEPEVGNEENPFHQPVDYTQKVEWGIDRYRYMEKPYGESYFPGPEVGYSQVKATSYGLDLTDPSQLPVMAVGYTLSQFYTARDFPTQVDNLPLEQDNYENDLTLLLFGARYTNRVATSQGFRIILNDMHGKQKSTATYDNNGMLISSTQYLYNVNDAGAQRQTLNNTVLAMGADGTIPEQGTLVGTDVEVTTDLRESVNTTTGTDVSAYAGGFNLIWVIPYFGADFNETSETFAYNSASMVKVIRQYGLLKQVRTTQNGSTLTADNLLWDAQTGGVLLTRNQNEFDDYTYSFDYPAYRAYDGMAGAYENLGAVISGFSAPGGQIPNTFDNYLASGDELVGVDPGSTLHGWVVNLPPSPSLILMDQTGVLISAPAGNYMVVRSGRRNMLNASAGKVVTAVNPMVQGGGGFTILANVDTKVMDANAVTYRDAWDVPVPNVLYSQPTCNALEQAELPFIGKTINGITSNSYDDFNYSITENLPPPDCSTQPALFQAQMASIVSGGVTELFPTRSYIDFGPQNLAIYYKIQSVTLYLTATSNGTPVGNNGCYVRRVTNTVDCFTQGPILWSTQPTVTTTDQYYMTPSVYSSQSYAVDLTQMFADWYANKDISDFSVGLMLADESSPASRQMTFYGPNSTNPPYLKICYYPTPECTNPTSVAINPYYLGVKGNWRPDYNYAYQVPRTQIPGNSSQPGGTNIRTSGYYSSYSPFWTFALGGKLDPMAVVSGGAQGAVADSRWVWSSEGVHYDQKGNEVEDVDPLARYSSALFGYQQSLAIAVAHNARHNEIAYDGFEDYYFGLPTSATCPISRQLDLGLTYQNGQWANGNSYLLHDTSHTGNYCLNLNGPINVSRPAGFASPFPNIVGCSTGGCYLQSNEQAQGFAPIQNKEYLLSMWVNDGSQTTNRVSGLTVTINDTDRQVSSQQVPVVEGWKQVNVTFWGASGFNMQLNGNVWIDDIRLLPFNGQLKTFVYDDQTLRLMGQLDENNFGVLYEYDEEGAPIRVKKETEHGIMTVKENRESMKNN